MVSAQAAYQLKGVLVGDGLRPLSSGLCLSPPLDTGIWCRCECSSKCQTGVHIVGASKLCCKLAACGWVQQVLLHTKH